ncbi:MFS transporter [Limnobaculum zhutongyuii]|uniref:MFS transporter n=1 Tax=Limnobaculum zhutongyuii TaxID=2498113 RepID=A0A411WPK1_9GAMM|nr:MFS transporter [Limnobaculum zhutongyuii]QBH98151.1 MFS transporter [Limnobaculum zhutongyuii]TQS86342.1 MFS transporter [Limnobaculum zhutongyuii]
MSLQSTLPTGKPKTWKARYTILSLIWLAWLLSFLDRMVMSVSLPFIGRDLGLDTTQQGLIISAFFIGYASFQIPGGFLADKFGARKIMAIGIAWWSVFTSLTGMVFTLPLMLAVRFLFGIGEGCFPAASWKMISTYFPSKERGRATAIQSTVNTLGPALAVVVAAGIIGAFGWHMVFIVLGLPGLFIAAGIYFFTRDNPKDHPSITKEDLAELEADGTAADITSAPVPFKEVLKMPVLWQMAAIWFLFDITFWGFSTWLPSYLITVREFSLAKTGVMAAIPFLFGAGGTLLGGYFSDKFKPQRKMLYVLTAIIAAGFLYMTFTVASADMAVVYQCISALFMFFAMAMFWGILMDTIPNKIMGRASGIVNFGGQMAGVVSAPIMGWLIHTSGGSYNSAFIFMIIALIASALVTLTVNNAHSNKTVENQA